MADAIVGVHVAYVSYVAIGQLLIWLGPAMHWRWVRNPWFRWTHLIAIVIVGREAIKHNRSRSLAARIRGFPPVAPPALPADAARADAPDP